MPPLFSARDDMVLGPQGLWWRTPHAQHHFLSPDQVPLSLEKKLQHVFRPRLWLDMGDAWVLTQKLPPLGVRDARLLFQKRWTQMLGDVPLLACHRHAAGATGYGGVLSVGEKTWLQWMARHDYT
ncbi:MAG: hypothetical protein EBQ89_05225, partial [Alphaproteobacteria bacterium]|nr:hypothetical protein [Alphaproteobacteria bacterium]